MNEERTCVLEMDCTAMTRSGSYLWEMIDPEILMFSEISLTWEIKYHTVSLT